MTDTDYAVGTPAWHLADDEADALRRAAAALSRIATASGRLSDPILACNAALAAAARDLIVKFAVSTSVDGDPNAEKVYKTR